MAVKASVTITISKYRDTDSITRYYKLQASTAAAPAVPTTLTPSGWSTSEPTYTSGSTNTLYYTDCVVFSDGTFQYTDDGNGKAVKSSSYEAAKEAYNKAQAAQNTANQTQENLDNLEIGGRNYVLDSAKEQILIIPENNNFNTKRMEISPVVRTLDPTYKTFIFSCDAYYEYDDDLDHNTYIQLYFRNLNGDNKFNYLSTQKITKNWTRVYCKASFKDGTTVADADFMYFRVQSNAHGAIIHAKNFKAEKGDKNTDWTPAPEDMASQDNLNDSYNTTMSRGEQLITNGSAILKNNYNFSQFEYDGTQSFNSAGSFKRKNKNPQPAHTDEIFPVNPDKTYFVSEYLKSENGTMRFYDLLLFYDVDKKEIRSTNHMFRTGSTTELAEDLKNGDTIVHLVDASGFDETLTQEYRRGFIIWNYKNSTGYQYPPETYSRNTYRDLFEQSGIDKTNNTITLKTAWNKGTIPAGTKLSQCDSGADLKYLNANALIPTEWTRFTGVISGIDYTGTNVAKKFPPGTAFASMGWLWNYNNVDEYAWVTNVSVTEHPSSDSIIKTITTLYYASNSSTPPSKPSDHVWISDNTRYKGWTKSLPIYNESYPYLYTCQETFTNGQTYSWTSVEQTTYTEATENLKETTQYLDETLDNILDQTSQNGGKNIHLDDSAEDYFIMFKQKGNTHIKNGIPKPIKALPSTYQRLRYVEVPKEAYIDLGIPISTNYSMETKIDVNGLTTNNQYFLGEAPGYISHLYIRNATNGRYIGVGNHRKGTWETSSYKYEDGQPFIVETIMKPKLICKVNNNIVYEDDQNMTDYTSSYNGILFAYRFNGSVNTSYAFQGRCYYFKLFDQNGNLIRDLIPCYEHNEYEGTDQEDEHPVRVGFYDRVTETFLTNSGTGTFVKGANVGDLRTDISDGNKRFQTYNFTLEGNNLNADDYLADDGIHIVDKSIIVQSGESSINIDDMKDNGHFYCNVPATLEGHTLTFGSALSSDTVVLYESTSETVIPYTDRQQDEYEHIINLYTYQDNTNIYSDGNLEIEYVRNNGLNIYQLKSDSEKRYKITNEKIATIENENGEIKLTAENAKNLSDDNDKAIKQLQKDLNEFKVTSEGVQNTLKSKGGNNLALYTLELWTSHSSLTESDINEIKSNSLGGRGYILGNGTSELNIPVPNGTYTISFKYKKIGTSGTTATVKINDETPGTILTKTVWGNTYALTSSQPEDWVTNYKNYYTVNNGVYYHVSGDIAPTWVANTYYKLDLTDYIKTVNITNNNIKIEIIGNSNNMLYMCDLMVNPGEIAETWTQNPNETRTDTVTIGKGIKVENSNSNTYTKIDDDGTRVFNNENKDNPEEVARFTKEGINVKEIVVREKANISGIVIQEIGGQTWITSIL